MSVVHAAACASAVAESWPVQRRSSGVGGGAGGAGGCWALAKAGASVIIAAAKASLQRAKRVRGTTISFNSSDGAVADSSGARPCRPAPLSAALLLGCRGLGWNLIGH